MFNQIYRGKTNKMGSGDDSRTGLYHLKTERGQAENKTYFTGEISQNPPGNSTSGIRFRSFTGRTQSLPRDFESIGEQETVPGQEEE